jgi:RIO-like serine/threonine protein kinase
MGIDIKKYIFIGQGRSGRVYLMPDGRVIKVFNDQESCVNEYMILEAVRGNKHFPIAYECRDNYIIRDYVDGICVENYIRKYGLSPTLAKNLAELIQDFEHMGFTRLDMRCSHIFVQDDESVMVIDPRNHYTDKVPYPKKMLGTLRKLKASKKFMRTVKSSYPQLYSKWRNRLL